MDRRTFLAGTGAVLLAAPLAASAQQGKVYRIGLLEYSEPDPARQAQWNVFREEMRQLGDVEEIQFNPQCSSSRGPLISIGQPATWEAKMARLSSLVLVALMLMSPAVAVAGPAEEANAVIDRWSAAYTSNDPEEVAKNYWPDAILLGTVSPVISVGTEAIRTYFSPLKGSGNKNAVGERHTIVVSENAVVLTGFYEFTGMSEGKPVPRPSRFTMLITKRGGEWHIAHHHSSPHVQPKK
jgi:uncharacterized protein (TIGR02246 family)